MTMARLNMWQRLGVVLSVLWILGGGYWARTADLDAAQSWKETNYRKCIELTPDHPCLTEADKAADLFLASSWEYIAVFVFGTLLLSWFVGYIAFQLIGSKTGRRAAT